MMIFLYHYSIICECANETNEWNGVFFSQCSVPFVSLLNWRLDGRFLLSAADQ